jgi:tight adherence protein C
MITLIIQNDVVRIVALLLIFGLVVGGATIALAAMSRRSAVRGELQKLQLSGSGATKSGPGLRVDALETGWSRIAKAIEDAGLNLTDTNQERLSKSLRAAGFNSPSAPKIYTLVRLCLIFLLPLTYVLMAYSSGEPPGFMKLYFIGSILALAGLFLPSLFVRARADRRKEEIVNGFPDSLDLMLVCVESGLGLEAAIDRVGREMVISHPRVAELLSLTVLNLRAGASREEAFRKLADASAVEDIRSVRQARHQHRYHAQGLCCRDARKAADAGRGEGAQAAGADFDPAGCLHAPDDDRDLDVARRGDGGA